MLTLLLTSMLISAFNIHPVNADPTTIIVPDDYPTIQEAVNAANTGDTIHVKAGTYSEHVIVNKALTLIGEGGEATIIDGGGVGNVTEVVADGVTITGFTIRNSGKGWPNSGTALTQVKDCNISKNNVANNYNVILLEYCSYNTISGNNVTSNNDYGIYLKYSSNNTVSGNNVENNGDGIKVYYSSNNSISRNNIANTWVNLYLYDSSNNKFYHNNIINNTKQLTIISGSNTWDDGYPSGGNYWSDYVGTDLKKGPNQNQSGNDGIADMAYIINEYNRDNYPLVGIFSSFNTSLGKHVNVVSNSTIEDFEYFESNSTIRMYVSGEEGFGFSRVCIPYTLMDVSNISVIIDDGLTPVLYPNYTLYDNGTHRWIYFAYEHSTHEIDIIPEFPSPLILPLFMIATLLTVIIYRREHPGLSIAVQKRPICISFDGSHQIVLNIPSTSKGYYITYQSLD